MALALSVMNGRCFQSAGIPSDAIPMGDGLTAVPAGAHVDLVVAFGYTPASGAVFTMPTHGVSADLATNMAWYLQVDKIDLGVLQEGEYPYQLAIAGGTGSSGLGCTGTIAAV
ncbi:hypothetical protein [Nocardia arthritidis]|uniref:Uncharacterized protein n=1 Tax=Nocardia arthritidis TaxID=228602 RepID=A0A6G9YL36_9NOCA|nr:hypothetical protein [Nocardia arthritidis]QIS14015.1 hypothetical protein F5544_30860 [Nocardia arthritidis]